jgi:hypothetical protein
MNFFKEEETFEPGSAARQAAYALVRAGDALTEIQPGWEFSRAKRAGLGLDQEFGDAMAVHYQQWGD